jgi:hypothetical protein
MVTIEVARMKKYDAFGRTHAAYARVEVPQAQAKPKKKTSRKKK